METKFKIRDTKDKKVSAIQLAFNHANTQIRFSTPYTIVKKDWLEGYPKAINSTKQVRTNLDTLKLKLDTFINETIAKLDRVPTKAELSATIAKVLGKESTLSLKALYSEYLANKQDANVFAVVTERNVNRTFELFFSLAPTLEIADVNRKLAEKFTTYLIKEKFQPSTINKHLKNIKTFLNWCYLNDYSTINLAKYFKAIPAPEKEIIALTSAELSILENSSLKGRHERIIDLFLLSCYTGLRFSDVIRINSEMIIDNHIIIQQQKTKTTSGAISIPILSKAKQILEKYNYQLPTITNQRANEYLKEAFVKLELDRKVFDQKLNKYLSLADAATFHISRKSFITIALSKGIPAKIVQAISGHKVDRVFNKYIAFSNNVLATEMQKFEG